MNPFLDPWWATPAEGLTQGAVFALLAVACAGPSRRVDLSPIGAFTLGLYASSVVHLALGFRPGPTPDVHPALLVGCLALGLFAALAVAVPLTAARWPFLLGAAVLVVVHLGARLLRGDTPEPAIRLFRPHELLPGVDDVQLLVIVVAALALALRSHVPPIAVNGALAGVAGFLYLLKVPGSAWYLTGVLVGVYALTAAVLGLGARATIAVALALGLVQVCFESVVGARWWLPFAAALLFAAIAFRLLRGRFRKAPAPALA
ncbi:hypothetical protein [Umezawaea sp. Da 62-37]|uniref:hypothetical protein n=1 Tax=Umezawaea sp. Da 62-37 TaxID=3075927 RepID=UPI0028F6F0BF|nr:hypothetical protein [Umezawaea sp. Da 62-37]WNV89558.1 hypothetical protein RM788_15020 [Umezawaea sp. Da 62-37]